MGLRLGGRRALLVAGESLTYAQRVLAIPNLLAYWKLDEASGTNAADSSGNGRNGTYSGVTLAQTAGPGASMGLAGLWDGVNDTVDVFSAGLASVFPSAAGSLVVWFKVDSAAVWNDATVRVIAQFRVDGNNSVLLYKNAANSISAIYTAGGTAKSVTNAYSALIWSVFGITWDKVADQVKVYLNAAQLGSTQTGLGTWSGTIATAYIGSASGPSGYWSKYIQQTLLYGRALSAAEITTTMTAV